MSAVELQDRTGQDRTRQDKTTTTTTGGGGGGSHAAPNPDNEYPTPSQKVIDAMLAWLGPTRVGSTQLMQGAEFVRRFGEPAVLHGISEAARANATHWNYVEKVCENRGNHTKHKKDRWDGIVLGDPNELRL